MAYFAKIKKSALLGGSALILIAHVIAYVTPTLSFMSSQDSSSSIQLEGASPDSSDLEAVSWRTLQSFDYKKNVLSPEVEAILDKNIKIPGFAVPLSDELSEVKEFLLVPNQMACIHVPAPPPNLIVFVTLDKGRSIRELSGPLWVKGELKVQITESTYGAAAYEMNALNVEPYTY